MISLLTINIKNITNNNKAMVHNLCAVSVFKWFDRCCRFSLAQVLIPFITPIHTSRPAGSLLHTPGYPLRSIRAIIGCFKRGIRWERPQWRFGSSAQRATSIRAATIVTLMLLLLLLLLLLIIIIIIIIVVIIIMLIMAIIMIVIKITKMIMGR